MEKDHKSQSEFVERVSPFFDLDQATGQVTLNAVRIRESLGTPPPSEEEAAKEYERDPQGFIKRQVDAGLTSARAQLDSETGQRAELSAKYAAKDGHFTEYLKDTDAAMKLLPPQQRAVRGTLENVYHLIRARDIDRSVAERVKSGEEERKRNEDVIRTVKVQGSGGGSPGGQEITVALSDKELRAASAMGISPEKYAKNKAELEAQGKE